MVKHNTYLKRSLSRRMAGAACAALAVGAVPCPAAPQAAVPQVTTPQASPLTLSQAVAAALATNPTARAAAQQLAQVQARVGQALAQRRPQITFNSTVSGSDASVIQPPPAHETFGTVQNTLTVPLPIGSKQRLAVQQAQFQLAAAQAQFESARLAVASQVGTAFYDLLRKQALLRLAQGNLAQAQRQYVDAQRRNRAGDVPQLDVLRAQVPVAAAQAQQFGAENDVAVAQQTINSLLGQPLDAFITVADVAPGPAVLTLTLDQARARALRFSPDLRAAEATVNASRAALESARLYREPALSLQAIDIRSNDQTSFSRVDTLQASVTVPLSDGGLGREQVREAQAALAQAQAQAEASRRTVLAGVSSAYLTAQSARRQVAAALVARDVAQTSYDKTVRGYQNGLFPLTDVLNAQTALTQARLAYTQATYDAAVAAGALNAAVSGGVLSGIGNIAAPVTPAGPPGANPPNTGPAGASMPGTTPAGNSTTGPNPGNPGGRGTP